MSQTNQTFMSVTRREKIVFAVALLGICNENASLSRERKEPCILSVTLCLTCIKKLCALYPSY